MEERHSRLKGLTSSIASDSIKDEMDEYKNVTAAGENNLSDKYVSQLVS